ncbi:MAG: WYL domain-containing protein, partial [Armatimonadetes bacterium]|nr:WYL domain-containing protein [Armatimonadota bacterium]
SLRSDRHEVERLIGMSVERLIGFSGIRILVLVLVILGIYSLARHRSHTSKSSSPGRTSRRASTPERSGQMAGRRPGSTSNSRGQRGQTFDVDLAGWAQPIWADESRSPVTAASDPTVRELLAAQRTGKRLLIQYYGGSHPGGKRWIVPQSVYTVSGSPAVYCDAYCETRREVRCFRCDRLRVTGGSGP